MRKIDTTTKRRIDAELTGQLLHIQSVRDELMVYANRFLERFSSDTYRLFDQVTLPQLCKLSVKGGLGIVNLEAQLKVPPPDVLVWEGDNPYYGDCDLNLVIETDHYPAGRTTGEVMQAVAQRTEILLVEAIADTRYSTLLNDLRGDLLEPPLYRCNQIEALAHLVDFVSQDLEQTVPLPNVVVGTLADLDTILQMIEAVLPSLAEIVGDDLNTVVQAILGGQNSSNDWLVFDDREENLLFVTDLNAVRSSWSDVDHSFAPYAPGRMDSLGYEVNELAIDQQKARQLGKSVLPYDVFKIVTSNFIYALSDTTNERVDPHHNPIFQPVESYNLSMYANNLIDDFVLLRTALRFHGYSVRRHDVQAAGPGQSDYTVEIRQGAGKCEFVDVAIPRIGSPEWFYCRNPDKQHYVQIPQHAPPGAQVTLVNNFDYQVEENLNLLIELGIGLSHSVAKSGKRVIRFVETWIHCDSQNVFPRAPGAPVPPSVPPGFLPFEAPVSLTDALTSDYTRLFGLGVLPDWLYNEVFGALFTVKQTADVALPPPVPGAPPARVSADEAAPVIAAARALGEVGIVEIIPMADAVDGPEVVKLRGLLANDAIEVNWVTAAYLILKTSQITDVIWFPRFGIFKVLNAASVSATFQVATSGPPLAAGDFVAVTWDARTPGPPLSFFTLPAADVDPPGGPAPVLFDSNLVGSEQKLYNIVRDLLLHANNQALRVAYGRLLNCLLRTSANAYMSQVIPEG